MTPTTTPQIEQMQAAIADLQQQIANLTESLEAKGILTPPAPDRQPSARCEFAPIDISAQWASAITDIERQLGEVEAKIATWQAGDDPEYPRPGQLIPPYAQRRQALIQQRESLQERQAKSNGTYRSYLQSKGQILPNR